MYADELALLANAPDVTLQEKRYARDVTRGNCSSYVRYIRPTLMCLRPRKHAYGEEQDFHCTSILML